MFLSPPNSYVEILIPNIMVLGGGAFERGLGHEGRTLINGITALIKRYEKASFLCYYFLPYENTMKGWLSANQEVGPYQIPDLLVL